MSDHLFRRRRKSDGKPTGPWIAWGYDAKGDRWQESTRQRDRRAAEAVYRELERRYADPSYARAATATLNSAFVLLIDDRKSRASADPPKCSMDTVKMYEQKAGTWIRVLRVLYPEKDPFLLADLAPDVVDAFLKRRRLEKVKEHTLHKELTTLRAALRLAKRAGTWKGDIEELIPPGFSPGYKPRKRFLTPGELPLLFGELPTHGAAIVAFVIATSARRSEVFRAKKKGVAPDLSTAHLPGKKTELADRVVPIEHPMAKELLKFAVDNAGTDDDDELLFLPWPSPNHAIRRACVRAKIPHTSFNDLRRTFATWLRQAGVPSSLVAPAMGHSDTRMVDEVYGELPVADLARQTRAALALASAQAAAQEAAEKLEAERRAKEAALAAEAEGVRRALLEGRCSNSAADSADRADVGGQNGRFSNEKRPVFQGVVVGHDRLELSANGLRVRGPEPANAHDAAEIQPDPGAAPESPLSSAAIVQQPLRPVAEALESPGLVRAEPTPTPREELAEVLTDSVRDMVAMGDIKGARVALVALNRLLGVMDEDTEAQGEGVPAPARRGRP